jgi:hypothetical protein
MTTYSADIADGDQGLIAGPNNLRKDLLLGVGIIGTETYASTITIDWSDSTKGMYRQITMTGNPTLVFSNPKLHQKLCIRFVQDASPTRTPIMPAGVKYPFGGTLPALSGTSGGVDWLIFICTAIGGSPTFDCLIGGLDLQ